MVTSTKRCVCCKERKRNEEMIQTPNKQWFCGVDCIAAYANKKYQTKKTKEFKKETKVRKEAIKKRTGANGYYDNLSTQLHYYIKHILRKGEPCYTCGKPQSHSDSGQAFHVGHFIPQKGVDPRRFMLENLRMQCYACNTHNSGMRAEYRQRMIEEVGIDKVEWLECDANHKSLKEQYPDVSDIKAETSRYRKLNK